MRIGNYEFKPRLVLSLITLTLLPVLISLGLWQLDRAVQKRELQALLYERLAAPETSISSTELAQTDMLFRRVRIHGFFDGQRQYLLDNRIDRGQAGYEVYTPLRIEGGAGVVLVNRGWVPVGQNRTVRPDIKVSSDALQVSGVLSYPPGQLLTLGETDSSAQADWPKLVRDINLQQIGKELGYTMPPYVLQLDASNASAYVQIWKPYADSPQKNQSYAIQWFSMAVVLLLIYIGLNSRRISSPEED